MGTLKSGSNYFLKDENGKYITSGEMFTNLKYPMRQLLDSQRGFPLHHPALQVLEHDLQSLKLNPLISGQVIDTDVSGSAEGSQLELPFS